MNNQMKIAYLISNIEEYGKFLSFLINNDISIYHLYWNEGEKGDRCYHIDWKEKGCYCAPQECYINNNYKIVKPSFVCNQYGDYEMCVGENNA